MASVRHGADPTLWGIILAALALLVPTGTATAGSAIPAGYDLFETDPGATFFAFQAPDTAIPPDFFGPGSDPFVGVVPLGGEPLGSFMTHDIGDTDTIVQRMTGADPMPVDTVPIEIVALNLVSVEPIRVTYNGGQGPEQWNVSARLSSTVPSRGSMTITQPVAGGGGTFDSQLQVVPLLTFTRLADGLTRDLDAGTLPQATLDKLVLTANDVPWQPGCKLPALSVPELNPLFCPGLTPAGRKKRTIEQALLAQHGVLPAQPQLEHFRCYALEVDPFGQRQVTLTDQFGTRTAQITKRAELCNPVRKNAERYRNRAAHLQCYVTTADPIGSVVAVQNQLGSQRLRVGKPARLCLPTRKRLILSTPTSLPRIAVPIDHFQCYAVSATTAIRTANPITTVTLKDEFRTEQVDLGAPYRLCAPVRKNQTLIKHAVKHLVCYRAGNQPIQREVAIKNQFENLHLRTDARLGLCIPSNKLVISP